MIIKKAADCLNEKAEPPSLPVDAGPSQMGDFHEPEFTEFTEFFTQFGYNTEFGEVSNYVIFYSFLLNSSHLDEQLCLPFDGGLIHLI